LREKNKEQRLKSFFFFKILIINFAVKMNAIDLDLYNVIRKELNLSEEKSQKVTKSIQKTVTDSIAENEAATKEFVNRELKGVATKEFVGKEIAELRAELKTDISETKADLLKWFMGGFITIVLMLIGLFITILFKG
jgi:ferritin